MDSVSDATPDADLACSAPGALDPSFGAGGVTAALFGADSPVTTATSVAIDPLTSRILIGGSIRMRDGRDACLVARLQTNGTLDPSFGVNGATIISRAGHDCWLNAVALQSDGKVIGVGGINGETLDGTTSHEHVLVRVLPDGGIDPAFGQAGMVKGQPGGVGHAEAVAIDQSDRIVVAGHAYDGLDVMKSAFTTARYQPDGTLDPSFDTDGLAEHAFSNGWDLAFDVALQPDGRILVVGWASGPNTSSAIGLVRYELDGSRDSSFGSMGLATVRRGAWAESRSIALDDAGRAVVLGGIEGTAALVRLTDDGQPDPAFGSDGVALFPALPTTYALTRSPQDGKLLAVGWEFYAYQSSNMAVARFEATGVLDSSFGTNGLTLASSASPSNLAYDVAVQPDGRVIVVGTRLDHPLVLGTLNPMDAFAARFCP